MCVWERERERVCLGLRAKSFFLPSKSAGRGRGSAGRVRGQSMSEVAAKIAAKKIFLAREFWFAHDVLETFMFYVKCVCVPAHYLSCSACLFQLFLSPFFYLRCFWKSFSFSSNMSLDIEEGCFCFQLQWLQESQLTRPANGHPCSIVLHWCPFAQKRKRQLRVWMLVVRWLWWWLWWWPCDLRRLDIFQVLEGTDVI